MSKSAIHKVGLALGKGSFRFSCNVYGEAIVILADDREFVASGKFGEVAIYDSLAEFELACLAGKIVDSFSARELPYSLPIHHEGKKFAESLEFCSVACDRENSRYALGGVCWDGTNLVATDGRRLHWLDAVDSGYPDSPEFGTDAPIIQLDNCKRIVELFKLFKVEEFAVSWAIGRNQFAGSVRCSIWSTKFQFTFSRLEGRFPAWKEVVRFKDNWIGSETFDRDTLANRCKELIAVRNVLNKVNKEKEPAACRIDQFGIEIDAKYLADSLGKKLGKLGIRYHGDTSPIFVENECGSRAVIMPLRKAEKKDAAGK